MIRALLETLIEGRDGGTRVTLSAAVAAALADLEPALDYGFLGLRAYSVVFSLWPIMTRAYERLAAIAEIWIDDGGEALPLGDISAHRQRDGIADAPGDRGADDVPLDRFIQAIDGGARRRHVGVERNDGAFQGLDAGLILVRAGLALAVQAALIGGHGLARGDQFIGLGQGAQGVDLGDAARRGLRLQAVFVVAGEFDRGLGFPAARFRGFRRPCPAC